MSIASRVKDKILSIVKNNYLNEPTKVFVHKTEDDREKIEMLWEHDDSIFRVIIKEDGVWTWMPKLNASKSSTHNFIDELTDFYHREIRMKAAKYFKKADQSFKDTVVDKSFEIQDSLNKIKAVNPSGSFSTSQYVIDIPNNFKHAVFNSFEAMENFCKMPQFLSCVIVDVKKHHDHKDVADRFSKASAILNELFKSRVAFYKSNPSANQPVILIEPISTKFDTKSHAESVLMRAIRSLKPNTSK